MTRRERVRRRGGVILNRTPREASLSRRDLRQAPEKADRVCRAVWAQGRARAKVLGQQLAKACEGLRHQSSSATLLPSSMRRTGPGVSGTHLLTLSTHTWRGPTGGCQPVSVCLPVSVSLAEHTEFLWPTSSGHRVPPFADRGYSNWVPWR